MKINKRFLCSLVATVIMGLLMSSSAFSAPREYVFTPVAGDARACQSLGMRGKFIFEISASDNRVGQMKFIPSGQKIVVLRDGPQRWRMSIQGSWSESIDLNFATRTFDYGSSRPGRSGYCEATFR